MATPRPSPHPSSAALWLVLPLWVMPLALACWMYLAAGNGGQDVSAFWWLVAFCDAWAPYHLDNSVRFVGLAFYVLAFGIIYAVVGAIAISGPAAGRHNAREALAWGALLLPMVGTLPYVMGVVAGLPESGFSIVEGTQGYDPEAGLIARRASGLAFSGVLMAVGMGLRWREVLPSLLARETRPRPGRTTLMATGVAVVLGLLVMVGTLITT